MSHSTAPATPASQDSPGLSLTKQAAVSPEIREVLHLLQALASKPRV